MQRKTASIDFTYPQFLIQFSKIFKVQIDALGEVGTDFCNLMKMINYY